MGERESTSQAREPQHWRLTAESLLQEAASLRERNTQLERQLNGRDCDICGNELPPDKPEKWRSCAECYEKLQRECEGLRVKFQRACEIAEIISGKVAFLAISEKSYDEYSAVKEELAALRGAQK